MHKQIGWSAMEHPDSFSTFFHYIHQNPLIFSLVNKIEDWEFCSFPDHA